MTNPRSTDLTQYPSKTKEEPQNGTINSGDHSPMYFHTIYPIQCKPNALYSSYRMSQLPFQPQLMISGCYDELLADPALLQSFPQDEWTSIHQLPHLGALCFWMVSEGLFSQVISPELWGQAGVNIITNSGRRALSEEVIAMTVLVTEGVDEGSLGMVTIFCHSDQARVEPSTMLLTLLQYESPEPGIVLMKIFTYSPYFPWGSCGLPFLDLATLPEGASSIRISTFPAKPAPATQVLLHPGCSALRGRGRQAHSHPLHQRGTMEELCSGPPFVLSGATLSSHCFLPHQEGQELTG